MIGKRHDAGVIVGLIGAMWLVHVAQWMAQVDWNAYGLVPRTAGGLIGVVTMPFLHGSLGHLLGNTVSLVILLTLALAFHAGKVSELAAEIALVGGGLLWLVGRDAVHIGASGLIYGLAAFLIVAGFAERRLIEIIGSIIVALTYGFTLLWGVLPIHQGVSWDGHLTGAIAGGLLAWFNTGRTRKHTDG